MAYLESSTPDGGKERFASIGSATRTAARHSPERLKIGTSRTRYLELVVYPNSSAEAISTLAAIRSFVVAMHHLGRAKMEEEERAALWPTDDRPVDNSAALISGHMHELMTFAQRVARANVNVLITGESGTGKEILARAIHDFSDRAQKPFVPVNCAAVPRELLESQLFGHRRGAFTGAERDHTGFIRAARDGTLFLDEIADLSLELQPKLLRFLESGEISPLGDAAPQHVNVRVLAATNTNLEDAVRAGRFREDLFYRLNVVRLSIRPLRERRDEIPGLVNHFITRFAQEFQKGQLTLAEETMERLLLYRWPGNVRQLQNELRRIVALAEPNATLLPEAISDEILRAMPIFRHASNGRELAVSLSDKLPATLAKIEREMIKTALQDHRGKVDAAARALGISRKGLYLKRQRFGL
jgi:hydrogenase-4 transcriptional activator